MRVLMFGSYSADRHPRVMVLIEGIRRAGLDVSECNVPLAIATDQRVSALRNPISLVRFAFGVIRAWARLWRHGRVLSPPSAVIVGYLGHFDIHLARRLWPESYIVLDHLVSGEGTATDRGITNRLVLKLLKVIDDKAVEAADLVLVDTIENQNSLPTGVESLVVSVGAPESWFHRPMPDSGAQLRVIFFGSYTPLQGATVIGEAISRLKDVPIRFTMVGTGQDLGDTKKIVGSNPSVEWIEWVAPELLPSLVAAHQVCLGIFGTTRKALNVVPNKVYEGAASGCAIVTSNTPPQVRAMERGAVFIPPGDATGLAQALERLAGSRGSLDSLRDAAYELAEARFAPAQVVSKLVSVLAESPKPKVEP